MYLGIVAGEESGDYLGAQLITALGEIYPDVVVKGIGGQRMEAAGAQIIHPMEAISVIGLDGLFRKFNKIINIRKSLRNDFIAHPPDVFVGIDVPDFNLGLEGRLRKAGIPVVHYVSPTVWAWRGYRIHRIRRTVDHMITLFPFERDYYQREGVPVTCVGHPLADDIEGDLEPRVARQRLQLQVQGRLVAVLPGSRHSEINRHALLFLRSAECLLRNDPTIRFIVPLANESTAAQFVTVLNEQPDALQKQITVKVGVARDAMSAADVVLLASGTATLEAALLRRPMVVAYRVSRLTQLMVRLLGHVSHYSMPNHLTHPPVVPELMQDDATPQALSDAVWRYLNDAAEVDRLKQVFAQIHDGLRGPGSRGAARVVHQIVTQSHAA